MHHLTEIFRSAAARRTKAGRRLSDYFIEHWAEVPFETAASIANHLGLSPMTVTRYLRDLGFNGLDALKAELRRGPISSAWEITEDLAGLRRDLQEGRLLTEIIAQQIDVLQGLNRLSATPAWEAAVERLIAARLVFVASYQNISGIGRCFVEQLSYMRDGVRYMDGLNGTYLELFEGEAAGRLLVLIDCRRFASKSRLLATAAREAGIATLIITDSHGDWSDLGETILTIPALPSRLWDSFMPLAALLDLLITSAVIAQGEAVVKRHRLIQKLQDRFGDFERR